MSAVGRVLGVSGNSVIDAVGRDLTVYAPQAIVSPWSERGSLSQVVIADLFGEDLRFPLGRSAAMGIPAVARARHLVTGDLAKCPLRQLTNDTVDEAQPAWMTRTDGAQSPWLRMLWTIDDLMFHGTSLWGVLRGGSRENERGPILEAARIPWDDWDISSDGRILYRGVEVERDDVILFVGPHEGVLNMGAGNSLRTALQLEQTVADRAANPVPVVELHYDGDGDPTDDEITEVLTAWSAARKAPGGAVAWTPKGVRAIDHGQAADNGFLVQARNAAAVDAARLMNVPAAMIDASNVNASLTYETLGGRNLEYRDRCLDSYAGAINARLSMDDVVPRGKRVALDLAIIVVSTPASTGAPTPD